jgi:hypothetical protein
MFFWMICVMREGKCSVFTSLFVSTNPLLLIASTKQDFLPFRSSLEPETKNLIEIFLGYSITIPY